MAGGGHGKPVQPAQTVGMETARACVRQKSEKSADGKLKTILLCPASAKQPHMQHYDKNLGTTPDAPAAQRDDNNLAPPSG